MTVEALEFTKVSRDDGGMNLLLHRETGGRVVEYGWRFVLDEQYGNVLVEMVCLETGTIFDRAKAESLTYGAARDGLSWPQWVRVAVEAEALIRKVLDI